MELDKPTFKKFSDRDIRLMNGFDKPILETKSFAIERELVQSLLTKFKLSIKLRFFKLKQPKDNTTFLEFEFIEREFNRMEQTIIDYEREIRELKLEIKWLKK